ncbi:MAG: TonB family protein [Pyrinomonadaceae bacterium]|nr:TonB family protein [Sphingobacteriaceae bacterium]
MFNPKSTIYQTGWLDLVFANRNKSYGAYELRLNADKRLVQSLFISSSIVVCLFVFPMVQQKYLSSHQDLTKPLEKSTEFDLKRIIQPPSAKLKPQEPAPAAKQPKSMMQKTKGFVEPVAVNHSVTEDPPKVAEMQKTVVGTQNTDGPLVNSNVNSIPSGTANGTGAAAVTAPGDGNSLVPVELLEKNPEFPGGMAAFVKYLQKNLRYPDQARDAGMGGKVFLSFIVERDGRLTDVKVLKGIGYGCDEEATRVLKKSPLWKPGIQNKREVRVLYTIPLVFELGE